MEKFKIYARAFYGTGIAGIGFLHFIYPGFRPVILPLPPESTENLAVFIYFTGAFLFISGLSIAFGKQVRGVSSILGFVLLLFFMLGHLPNRIQYHPEILGMWTDALKLLALSGGAFIVSHVFSDQAKSLLPIYLEKVTHLGKYFFGLMLVVFGIDHFLYLEFVKTLVPRWMPGEVFWSYFSGVALIGAGLSILFQFKVRIVSLLLAAMLFLWLIMLHIPRTLEISPEYFSNELISCFQCLAFCGIALSLYFETQKELYPGN